MSDWTLVYTRERERSGEPEVAVTLESLYATHADQVARWAQRLGGPGVDADDVVQQVFLVVQKRIGSLRSVDSVRAWLFRITQNEVRQARRRERRRRGWTGTLDEAEAAAAGLGTPQTELERKQAAAQVYAVLDRMGEKYRSLLILFQLEGLSGEQIAELTGLKIGTVWVRLHRARAQFLQLLEEAERRARR